MKEGEKQEKIYKTIQALTIKLSRLIYINFDLIDRIPLNKKKLLT